MAENETEQLIATLKEIRENQRLQLERQAEALYLQREQFDLVRKQHERAERIQDRAEAIQERSARLVTGARRVFAIVLPIIVVLIIYLSWLTFGR